MEELPPEYKDMIAKQLGPYQLSGPQLAAVERVCGQIYSLVKIAEFSAGHTKGFGEGIRAARESTAKRMESLADTQV